MSRILAGDIGGTKTLLGVFETGEPRPAPVRTARYASADWPGLAEVVRDFLGGGRDGIEAAAFAVAGPVTGDTVRTPNLAWDVRAAETATAAGLDRVVLLNDVEATAEGIPALREDEVETLAAGDADGDGNAALLAPGTGLGMCVIARPDGDWIPLAGEGGHQDFAPRDEREQSLRRYLAERYGRASLERVVSGPGLGAIYDFLVREEGRPPDPAVAAGIGEEDPAPAISRAAMDGSCPVCAEALRMFLSAWGAAAGNLALVALARSGVWLGGGIAPKVLPALRDGTFLEAFRAKGRFRELVTRIPVRVIRNPEAALLGAARRATASG